MKRMVILIIFLVLLTSCIVVKEGSPLTGAAVSNVKQTPFKQNKELEERKFNPTKSDGVTSCNDSDKGKNPSKRGVLTFLINGVKKQKMDDCYASTDFVKEFWCHGKQVKETPLLCKNGCYAGACK